MSILKKVARLAVQQLAFHAVGVRGLDRVFAEINRHLTDHDRKLTRALAVAHARSWTALEIALGGSGWWQQCVQSFTAVDEKALAAKVRTFLETCALPDLASDRRAFHQACLQELRAARQAGLLKSGSFSAGELSASDELLRRCADPEARGAAEAEALADVAEALHQAGHAHLATLITARPTGGQPLFVAAVRYFFRHAIEADRELFQALAFTQMDRLAGTQQTGFEALAEALASHGQRLEELLDSVAGVVTQTRDLVLDMQAELQGQRDDVRRLGDAVMAMLRQHQLQGGELQPSDSVVIQDDAERRLVKQLLERYRGLAPDQRQQLPRLLNGLGRLEVGTGDFTSAVADFEASARLATGPEARAEAHYHAYRAALECADWAEALSQFQSAVELDAGRYAPFPFDRYAPERILGASGLGTTFLCRAPGRPRPLVVKALYADLLDRDADRLLAEAQVLRQLGHPIVTPVLAGGHAGPAPGRGLFLVTAWFDAPTLPEYVQKHGPLTPEETVALARPLAQGLKAAHEKNLLHRGVKPSNVLVRKEGDAFQVRLIDFGLALRRRRAGVAAAASAETAHSLFGNTLAGGRDYTAPEQGGALSEGDVGPAVDVYGFGRTCCFALFRSARPLPKHWLGLPQPWKRLLQLCLQEEPKNRLRDFGEVLRLLDSTSASSGRQETVSAAAGADQPGTGAARGWWRRLWPGSRDQSRR